MLPTSTFACTKGPSWVGTGTGAFHEDSLLQFFAAVLHGYILVQRENSSR